MISLIKNLFKAKPNFDTYFYLIIETENYVSEKQLIFKSDAYNFIKDNTTGSMDLYKQFLETNCEGNKFTIVYGKDLNNSQLSYYKVLEMGVIPDNYFKKGKGVKSLC